MERSKNHIFYVKITKGHVPKANFDALASKLDRIKLRITESEIQIRESDHEDVTMSKILWDINWKNTGIEGGIQCGRGEVLNFSIHVKTLQKKLKAVKKKEMLIFYIEKSKPDVMKVEIEPANISGANMPRKESFYIAVQYEKLDVLPVLPEFYRFTDPESNLQIETAAYELPIVIKASEFQKIKKVTVQTKTTIKIIIQRNNYLLFCLNEEDAITNGRCEFGSLIRTPVEKIVKKKKAKETGKSRKKGSVSKKESVTPVDVDTDDSYSDCKDIYIEDFNVELITPLLKLPGMCDFMSFYAPKYPSFPIKVSMDASSNLGTTTVYIKNASMIENIEARKNG